MKSDVVYKKNPQVVTRNIDKETILVPMFKTSAEMNCIYSLNPAASKVWDLFDGKRSIDDIKKAILDKFDTTAQEVDKEIARLIKDLKDIKAVIEK